MSNDYIRETLAKDYNEDILNQQKKYLSEKKFRIQREQSEIMREQKRIELEEKEQESRRQQLIALQYQDYIRGLQEKENKTQKEFEQKLIPLSVSLPMKSEQALRSYHDRIYKLSDKADRNKKLFMDYSEKTKNNKYYNYLSKRYVINNRESNPTISENKDIPKNPSIARNNFIANDNNMMDDKNLNFYLNNYGAYKNVFKQYDNYNKLLADHNLRNKDYMNKQRAIEELKRIEEREKIYDFEKQEKSYENEKKREYREFLDRQIKENFPIKLWKENYNEQNFVNNTPFFKDRSLYSSAPHFSIVNKSNFVEVNPYNAKRYDLGKSDLKYNPILNPMFNYNYNKYLFPRRLNRELSSIDTFGGRRRNYNINAEDENPNDIQTNNKSNNNDINNFDANELDNKYKTINN
jgi:hypothetical protein